MLLSERNSRRLAWVDFLASFVSSRRTAALGIALLVVIGAKAILIAALGDETPFWDQWDAEAQGLYIPYLRGQLAFHDLLALHNEHRIFFTRIMALSIIELAGSWNTILQMLVNAALHVCFLLVLLCLFRDLLDRRGAVWMSLIIILFAALPCGWENILSGFQSQFYLLLLMGVPAVVLTSEARLFSGRWLIGLLLSIASFFCMASGALTPLASGISLVLRFVIERRRPRAVELAAAGVLFAAAGVLLHFSVAVPRHAALAATGPLSLAHAIAAAGGWPVRPGVIGLFVVNLPLAMLTWRLVQRRIDATGTTWRVVALTVWIWLQIGSLAYGRAAIVLSPRYLDILGLNVMLNGAAALLLLREPHTLAEGAGRRAGAVWLATIAAFACLSAIIPTTRHFLTDAEAARARRENLTAFVRNGDPGVLHQPFLFIPLDDADRLAAIAGQPEIRGILPVRFGATARERDAVRARLLLHGGVGLTTDAARTLAILLAGLAFASAAAWLALTLTYPRFHARTPDGVRM